MIINGKELKHDTKLICPDSSIGDYIFVGSEDFKIWMDSQDMWHINCCICGGQHFLGDMGIKETDAKLK